MRTTAAVLAALTAVLLAAVFLVGELVLDAGAITTDAEALGLVGAELAPAWIRAVLAAAGALPWIAGALLLVAGRPRLGTAVTVTAAVLAVPLAGGVAAQVLDAVRSDATVGWWTLTALGTVAWTAGTAAGLLAWLARPGDVWRRSAPGPGGPYTTAAVFAWLAVVFQTSAVAPPGAPRRFVELPAAAVGSDPALAMLVLTGLLVAAALWVAPRCRRDVAGAIALTVAVPQLLGQVEVIRAIASEPYVIPTPPGVLGAVGLVGLVVLGSWWVVDPPTGAEVSGAATDRGPVRDPGSAAPEPGR
jgi:hypothetical protein